MDKKSDPVPMLGSDPAFEELAQSQGVEPIDDFKALLGRPSPEDETREEFSMMLREWRHEGNGTAHHE